MFEQLSNMTSLLKQAHQMGDKVKEIAASLREKRVTGSAGAGMVEVVANGSGEIIKVSIEPSLVEKGEREMIEELVAGAVNQASQKAKALYAEEMKQLTGGMSLPGMDDAIAQFMGNGPPTP